MCAERNMEKRSLSIRIDAVFIESWGEFKI